MMPAKIVRIREKLNGLDRLDRSLPIELSRDSVLLMCCFRETGGQPNVTHPAPQGKGDATKHVPSTGV
jgi:hypothetical protein